MASVVHEWPRIALFTDTLADVNGVSRFVRAVAERAPSVQVIASTRLECPRADNIHNVPPVYRRPMPGYPTIELAIPPARAVRNIVDRLRPDVVHVSTPGPMGWIGRRYAMKRGLPLVATYHTDFPEYIEHLFENAALTRLALAGVRWFYRPFDRVLARSRAFAQQLGGSGLRPGVVLPLRPGMDTGAFHPALRDESGAVWSGVSGARASSVKLLYAGRVSVEKNLAMLARVWPRVRATCRNAGVDAQLVIVGDGPYRAELERLLAGHDAVFAGFRAGRELSALYASSDAFIFPSVTDTLGQAVMEAQASGLAAIVSDRGGPQDIVEHRRTGYVLPLEPAATAEALWGERAAELLTSPALRRSLGAAGRARVETMTIDESVAHFVELHADVARTKIKPGHALARGPARR